MATHISIKPSRKRTPALSGRGHSARALWDYILPLLLVLCWGLGLQPTIVGAQEQKQEQAQEHELRASPLVAAANTAHQETHYDPFVEQVRLSDDVITTQDALKKRLSQTQESLQNHPLARQELSDARPLPILSWMNGDSSDREIQPYDASLHTRPVVQGVAEALDEVTEQVQPENVVRDRSQNALFAEYLRSDLSVVSAQQTPVASDEDIEPYAHTADNPAVKPLWRSKGSLHASACGSDRSYAYLANDMRLVRGFIPYIGDTSTTSVVTLNYSFDDQSLGFEQVDGATLASVVESREQRDFFAQQKQWQEQVQEFQSHNVDMIATSNHPVALAQLQSTQAVIADAATTTDNASEVADSSAKDTGAGAAQGAAGADAGAKAEAETGESLEVSALATKKPDVQALRGLFRPNATATATATASDTTIASDSDKDITQAAEQAEEVTADLLAAANAERAAENWGQYRSLQELLARQEQQVQLQEQNLKYRRSARFAHCPMQKQWKVAILQFGADHSFDDMFYQTIVGLIHKGLIDTSRLTAAGVQLNQAFAAAQNSALAMIVKERMSDKFKSMSSLHGILPHKVDEQMQAENFFANHSAAFGALPLEQQVISSGQQQQHTGVPLTREQVLAEVAREKRSSLWQAALSDFLRSKSLRYGTGESYFVPPKLNFAFPNNFAYYVELTNNSCFSILADGYYFSPWDAGLHEEQIAALAQRARDGELDMLLVFGLYDIEMLHKQRFPIPVAVVGHDQDILFNRLVPSCDPFNAPKPRTLLSSIVVSDLENNLPEVGQTQQGQGLGAADAQDTVASAARHDTAAENVDFFRDLDKSLNAPSTEDVNSKIVAAAAAAAAANAAAGGNSSATTNAGNDAASSGVPSLKQQVVSQLAQRSYFASKCVMNPMAQNPPFTLYQYSPYTNIHVHLNPVHHFEDLAFYHSMFKFRRLGVVNDKDPVLLSLHSKEELRKQVEALGADVVFCDEQTTGNVKTESYAGFARCLTKLGEQQVDALYLLRHDGAPLHQLYSLLKPFIAKDIPVFSRNGASEVKAGALMSKWYQYDYNFGVYESNVISQLMQGVPATSISQYYYPRWTLTVNAAIAREIGWVPSYEDMLHFDITYLGVASR